MSLAKKSRALSVARAHMEAWSHHDWDTAQAALTPDVHVTATTTKPVMPPTDTKGVDAYMEGLKFFAGTVKPGSLRELASLGDDHNALVFITTEVSFGADDPPFTLPGARLYLIDDNGKICAEQVIFLVPD